MWNKILKNTTPFNLQTFKKLVSYTDRILDVGCGYGRIIKRLLNNGYQFIDAFDNSEFQINRAKYYINDFYIELSNASQYNFKENYYDAIICLEVIDSLTNIDDVKKLFFDFYKTLKDDKYCFINFYTRNKSDYFEKKYEEGFRNFKIKRVFKTKNDLIVKHYTLKELINIFDEYFDLVEIKEMEFLSFNQTHKCKGFSMILRKNSYKSNFI